MEVGERAVDARDRRSHRRSEPSRDGRLVITDPGWVQMCGQLGLSLRELEVLQCVLAPGMTSAASVTCEAV